MGLRWQDTLPFMAVDTAYVLVAHQSYALSAVKADEVNICQWKASDTNNAFFGQRMVWSVGLGEG